MRILYRWGLAYFLGSCIACRVSGGHLNPLLTVSLNLHHNLRQGWLTVIIMVIAQYLGALLAAILAFLVYWDGINWWVNLTDFPIKKPQTSKPFKVRASGWGVQACSPDSRDFLHLPRSLCHGVGSLLGPVPGLSCPHCVYVSCHG